MRRLLLFSVAAVLAFMVTPALAELSVDTFWIELYGNNLFDSGGGSGFNNLNGVRDYSNMPTPWYYYEYTDWYNQWFYDDPPDPDRYKVITYDITIQVVDEPAWGAPAWVTIALNWSTLAYPETESDGPPPLPPLTSQQENVGFTVRSSSTDPSSNTRDLEGHSSSQTITRSGYLLTSWDMVTLRGWVAR